VLALVAAVASPSVAACPDMSSAPSPTKVTSAAARDHAAEAVGGVPDHGQPGGVIGRGHQQETLCGLG